jgi:hypothetical protein
MAEVHNARAILEECRAELEAEGQAEAERTEIGTMVEMPATAVMADRMAAEVDFFSIGTNVLAQYTLAADRTHAEVAPLAVGFQPAMLSLVRDVLVGAHSQNKWVGLCGELAGDTDYSRSVGFGAGRVQHESARRSPGEADHPYPVHCPCPGERRHGTGPGSSPGHIGPGPRVSAGCASGLTVLVPLVCCVSSRCRIGWGDMRLPVSAVVLCARGFAQEPAVMVRF